MVKFLVSRGGQVALGCRTKQADGVIKARQTIAILQWPLPPFFL